MAPPEGTFPSGDEVQQSRIRMMRRGNCKGEAFKKYIESHVIPSADALGFSHISMVLYKKFEDGFKRPTIHAKTPSGAALKVDMYRATKVIKGVYTLSAERVDGDSQWVESAYGTYQFNDEVVDPSFLKVLQGGGRFGAQAVLASGSKKKLREALGIDTFPVSCNYPDLRAFATKLKDEGIGRLYLQALQVGMAFGPIKVHMSMINLMTMYYHHGGKPRTLYTIPLSDRVRFEKRIRELFKTDVPPLPCSNFLNHLSLWLEPDEAGNMVVISPGSIVWGVNEGFNIIERKYIAPKDWTWDPLPIGYKRCVAGCCNDESGEDRFFNTRPTRLGSPETEDGSSDDDLSEGGREEETDVTEVGNRLSVQDGLTKDHTAAAGNDALVPSNVGKSLAGTGTLQVVEKPSTQTGTGIINGGEENHVAGSKRERFATDTTPRAGPSVVDLTDPSSNEQTPSPSKKQRMSPEEEPQLPSEDSEKGESRLQRARIFEAMYDSLNQSTNEEVAKFRKERDLCKVENQEMKVEVKELKVEVKELKGEVKELKLEVKDLKAELAKLQARLKT